MRQRMEPPESARKVPGMKVWVTEDGTPYGHYGRLSAKAKPTFQVTCTTDGGQSSNRSLAQMVAEAWLGPCPAGHHLTWRDGDKLNCAASNLAWEPNLTNLQKHHRWKAKNFPKVLADPNHKLHGTRSGYRAGCRCERCRAWRKLYTRDLETRKLIEEVKDICGT